MRRTVGMGYCVLVANEVYRTLYTVADNKPPMIDLIIYIESLLCLKQRSLQLSVECV